MHETFPFAHVRFNAARGLAPPARPPIGALEITLRAGAARCLRESPPPPLLFFSLPVTLLYSPPPALLRPGCVAPTSSARSREPKWLQRHAADGEPAARVYAVKRCVFIIVF
jgi:hypothetical protein